MILFRRTSFVSCLKNNIIQLNGILTSRTISNGTRETSFPSSCGGSLLITRSKIVGMAKILSGTEVAGEIKNKLRSEVEKLRITPKLAVVQVGDREDSNVYIRMKLKFAKDVGVDAEHLKLPSSTTELQLSELIQKLNKDSSIHGIIVQLPFQSDHPIDSDFITNIVSHEKDVDGLSDFNAGKLFHGQLTNDECFIPCTPYGCLELIKKSGIQISGSHCVVLGRSKIVGSPMAQLLLWNDATVTIAHSRTKDVASLARQGDILVVATGVPHLVKKDWIKPGAVVIDCGITSVPDPSKKSGKKLVGDVDFDEVSKVAMAITPVPGGVGPMTVAMLIANTVQSAKRSCGSKTNGHK